MLNGDAVFGVLYAQKSKIFCSFIILLKNTAQRINISYIINILIRWVINMGDWSIFLSSCFSDSDGVPLSIRDRVAHDFNSKGYGGETPIWMGEDFYEIRPDAPTSAVEKALFCVEGVLKCDVYVAVIVNKHGSEVEVSDGAKAQASFFELELLAAAVSGKPTFVYILKDNEPDGKMGALLNLLGPSLPGLCLIPKTEDEVLKSIDSILLWIRHPVLFQLSRFVPSKTTMYEQLSISRHRQYDPNFQFPNVQFLSHLHDPTFSRPSLVVVKRLIADVDSYSSHQSKLALLWMAIRELMGEPLDKNTQEEVIFYWQAVLLKWTGSAAWYGLHGHAQMGCLGALSTAATIGSNLSQALTIPHGALASEYYSIARRVRRHDLKTEFFDLADQHIEIALGNEETSGGLAIQGSIYLQTGRNADAIKCYERVVSLKRDEGATDASIGESKAELGYALLNEKGLMKRGLGLLEEGVDMLESGPQNGFLVRAKRKLGVGYLKAFAPRQALGQFVDAYKIAEENGIFDQIQRLERIAKQIDTKLPFLRR
jgi:tetratricopeptide (TPR) repeat protein